MHIEAVHNRILSRDISDIEIKVNAEEDTIKEKKPKRETGNCYYHCLLFFLLSEVISFLTFSLSHIVLAKCNNFF